MLITKMDNEKKVIVGIKPSELEQRLALAFESVRGQSYGYMDCGGRHLGNWMNVYDKILSSFESCQREAIESAVSEIMPKPGVHRIMDQGCGHAQSLLEITRKMALCYPENEFLGYGISGSLKEMWLGGQEFDFRITPKQKELIKKYGIHHFQANRENYQFFGIEEDIHRVMSNFPYQLDLVFSDNTYFYLAAPWLALKRTVDKLTVGGVAMVRTLFNAKVHAFEDREIEEEEIVDALRYDNPYHEILSHTKSIDHRVLVVIKKKDIPFKTHQYLGLVDEDNYRMVRSFYSKRPPQSDFLRVDTL